MSLANALSQSVKARSTFYGKALAVESKLINFTSVKNIKFFYNPFYQDASSIRQVAFQMSVPKRKMTNPTCAISTDVKSDASDSVMEVVFANGHKAIFKTKELSAYEIIREFNKLCVVHDIKTIGNK